MGYLQAVVKAKEVLTVHHLAILIFHLPKMIKVLQLQPLLYRKAMLIHLQHHHQPQALLKAVHQLLCQTNLQKTFVALAAIVIALLNQILFLQVPVFLPLAM